MIPVTKPFSPPITEYFSILERIWENNWFTNNGPFVLKLEEQLKNYLKVQNLLFVTNGTIALQLALKALGVTGEVITTPFSYVATTSSILWEGCKPVFVDINPESLNIDPHKIENSITPETSAILATHVYGNPCDISEIQKIAEKYNLKVIYDAAHCFGTSYKGESVFKYGDISTASFHSTKIFHTIEGGAVFANDNSLFKKVEFLRNFGHNGPDNFSEIGINGKNSEFHAAMGLCNLAHIDEILKCRKLQYQRYLDNLSSINISYIRINPEAVYNYSYLPIILPNEENLIKVKLFLEKNNITPRRYFYPSLNTVEIFGSKKNVEISEEIAKRVLCLPLYHTLTDCEIDKICQFVNQAKQ